MSWRDAKHMTTGELQKKARLQRHAHEAKAKEKDAQPRIRVVNDEVVAETDFPTTQKENHRQPVSAELPDLGERYDVLGTIGQGGMGSVYKVFDRETEKILAIKVLHANLIEDQTALRRFEQEAEAASQLEHSNMVAVFAYGKTNAGAPYLVMDYIDGESLSNVVKANGALQPARALHLFQQICEALVHAHEKGVIHRDVKPANVIVSKLNDVETARIVDFGIAKILPVSNRETHNLTETRQVFGSPHYMSPEHCLGFRMDERSDIYSFGCLMYEVLTGDPPFPESDAIQVVIKHINDEVKPFPRGFESDPVCKKLEGVVLKCLEKDQDDRYQSVGELLKDLELIADGKSPSKFVRRKAAKLEYTASQILRAVFGTFLILMFVGSAVGWLNLGGNQFSAAGVLIACLVGAGLFGAAAVEQFRRLLAGKNTSGDCWNMVLLLSLVSMCLTQAPNSFEIAASSFDLSIFTNKQGWLIDTLSGLWLLHLISIVSALVSLVGGTLFGGEKKTSYFKVEIQYVCITYVLLLLSVSAFPIQVSSFTTTLSDADVLRRNWPDSSQKLLKLALKLDPLNQKALFSLVDMYMLDWRSEQANELFKDYFAVETAPKKLAAAHYKLSTLAGDNSWLQLQELTNAIQLSPRYDYYEHRGRLHVARGEYNDALKDYGEAIRSEPGSPEPYIGRAQIFAKTRNYQVALAELNGIAEQRSGWSNIDVFFLRALLFDKMGRHELALRDYMTVGEIAKTKRGLSANDAFNASYSFKMLGDLDNQSKYAELTLELSDKPLSYYQTVYRRMGLPLTWSK